MKTKSKLSEAESNVICLLGHGVKFQHAIDVIANICILSPKEKEELTKKVLISVKKAA